MKKNTIIIYTLLLSLIVSGCDDYLDVEPIGRLIPTYVDEFDRLLVGGDYSIHTTSDDQALFLSADDTAPIVNNLGDITSMENVPIRYIKWETDLYPVNSQIALWNNSYKNIYTYNFIIENIDEAIGNESSKARIKSEARTMRSYEYYILVNSFAKQYDPSTASEDAGVPIVTIPDVLAESYGRSRVQEVYDFILADLSESINDLPNDALAKTRANKAAGYGLLARVYLQMGDYQKAKANADLALGEQNTLGNYTTTDPFNMAPFVDMQQYVYRYFSGTSGYSGGLLTEEVLSLFDLDNDMRVNGIYTYNGFREGYVKYWSSHTNHCVSVSEMYVIRAECNARLSGASVQDVLDDLNTLRNNRIIGNVDLTLTELPTKEAALIFALEERRREMLTTGIRWFDLKRLNKEPEQAVTISHELDGEIYTLTPNSSRYVFPIPPETINFNPDMEQNIRD